MDSFLGLDAASSGITGLENSAGILCSLDLGSRDCIPYPQGAQTWITQFYHVCLYLVNIHQMVPPLTVVTNI